MTVADSITNALLRFGRPMTLRRKIWNGDIPIAQDVQVYGVTEGPLSEELTSRVVVDGEVTVTFSNAQITSAGWPGPPDKLDEMIIDDGAIRTIRAVEAKFLGTSVLVYVVKVVALNYDRLIRIERASVTSEDGFGDQTQQWIELATLSASKVDLAGTENIVAAQLGAEVTTRFQVPWAAEIADLTTKDRIVYPTVGGKIYQIEAVKEVMLKAGFEIFTTAAS